MSLFATRWGKLLVFNASFATQMFLIPSMVAMTIAATRMYRGLAEFTSGGTEMYDIIPFRSSLHSL